MQHLFTSLLPALSTPIVTSVANSGPTASNSFDWNSFWNTFIASAVGGLVGGLVAFLAAIYTLRKTATIAQRERDEERREHQREQEQEEEKQRLDTLRLFQTELHMNAKMAGVYGDHLCIHFFGDSRSVWGPIRLQTLINAQRYLHTVPPFVYEAIIKTSSRLAEYQAIINIHNAFQTSEPAYQLNAISGIAENARKALLQAAQFLETYINHREKGDTQYSVHAHAINISLLLRGRLCDPSVNDVIPAHAVFLIKDENFQLLGVGELDNGEGGYEGEAGYGNSTCLYKAEIKDVPASRFYLFLLGSHGWGDTYVESKYNGLAYTYEELTKLDWQISLEMDERPLVSENRIVKVTGQ